MSRFPFINCSIKSVNLQEFRLVIRIHQNSNQRRLSANGTTLPQYPYPINLCSFTNEITPDDISMIRGIQSNKFASLRSDDNEFPQSKSITIGTPNFNLLI